MSDVEKGDHKKRSPVHWAPSWLIQWKNL